MLDPRPSEGARLRANFDHAIPVAQYATACGLDLFDLAVTAHRVTAHVGNLDHAQRLAAGFNLHQEDVREHQHGTSWQIHTRWSDPSTPIQVVCVSKAEQVGRVA